MLLALSACDGGGEGYSSKAAVMEPVTGADVSELNLKYVNEASGILAESYEKAVIDYSNTGDGYIMVRYNGDGNIKVKVQVKGPQDTYSYTLKAGEYDSLPLSQGNGEYRVSVFENVEGNKYAQILSCAFNANIKDEFLPFLRPNVFVDYSVAPNAVMTAKKLTEEAEDNLDKVALVYEFVVGTLSYDKEEAATVTSGYVPDIDAVLAKRSGICFDYASLMTGMLRSCDVPCKLVVGYAGDAYHAWISVWVDGEGWVDNIIHFDGTKWERMDPTLASSDISQKEIASYVGDGSNYVAKYFY